MKTLEHLEDICINETTLYLASNLNMYDLNQLAEHFRAKRAALVTAKDKVTGLGLQEINNELKAVKEKLTKTNQAISMLQVALKEQKTKQKKDPDFAQRFVKEAEKTLPKDLFEKILKKARLN